MDDAHDTLSRVPQARSRLRMIQHYAQITRNMSKPNRFFGTFRSSVDVWLRRYHHHGVPGCKSRLPGPRVSSYRIPARIEALVLHVRRESGYGAVRSSYFLRRYR